MWNTAIKQLSKPLSSSEVLDIPLGQSRTYIAESATAPIRPQQSALSLLCQSLIFVWLSMPRMTAPSDSW